MGPPRCCVLEVRSLKAGYGAIEVLRGVDLEVGVGEIAGTLSGGEQQMLAIGRGLMSEPRLLMLDEPSLGLSPLLVEEMFVLIGQLNREGLAILLVEQNVVQSLAIAHRAYVLEDGRVTLSGKAADLAQDPDLRRSYLGH